MTFTWLTVKWAMARAWSGSGTWDWLGQWQDLDQGFVQRHKLCIYMYNYVQTGTETWAGPGHEMCWGSDDGRGRF